MSMEGSSSDVLPLVLVFVKDLVFVLFMDRAASMKHKPSTEGVRNKRFSTSKVQL